MLGVERLRSGWWVMVRSSLQGIGGCALCGPYPTEDEAEWQECDVRHALAAGGSVARILLTECSPSRQRAVSAWCARIRGEWVERK